jgi:hypothetical protein
MSAPPAKRTRADAGARLVAGQKEHLGGFHIIEAEDLYASLSWAAKTAGCVNTAIEVRSFWDQSGG